MKHPILILLMILPAVMFAAGANAQDFGPGNTDGNGMCRFIDENGDGFNDLAPDADGDGIPNGLDPDFVKPEDGTGMISRWAHRYGDLFHKYFGEDAVAAMNGMGGNHYGPGDGTGTGTGMGDGSGFGPGSGTGDFTGDGEGAGSQQQTQHRRGGRR